MKIFVKYLTVSVCFLAACTEIVDIKTDDAPSQIVIYGFISTDVKRHSIEITRSAGYFTKYSPQGVSNAAVTITDNTGKIIPLAENDQVPGLYQTADDISGEEGKTYTLDVITGAEHYQSKPAYLRTVNDIDSIGLQYNDSYGKVVDVLLYAKHFSNEKNNYLIFISIDDEVVNFDIERYTVLNINFSDVKEGVGVPCYSLQQEMDPDDLIDEADEELSVGDVVTVNINAISPEYATFISNVRDEIAGSNPIFGGPPANVPTNIQCISHKDIKALGFFDAFPSRYASTTVKKELFLKR